MFHLTILNTNNLRTVICYQVFLSNTNNLQAIIRFQRVNELLLLVVIIIIIIMSFRQYRYPWPSLATSPYCSSLLAGPQGYILYPHIAAVCKFELVVLFCLTIWGVHRSTSLMSSSLLLQQCPACLVCLALTVFVMGGRTVGALWDVAFRTCSKLLAAFLCSCRLAFSPAI